MHINGAMQYRRVGTSGLKVSTVSIGGWLTLGGSVDNAYSARILSEAVGLGVNFIDLADAYAKGGAETATGLWLMSSGVARHSLVISSKCFWPMSEDPNDRGLSRKHIVESVHNSLRRLRTDYLDIMFCHREDPETPLEETVRAMNDLIRQGKVLYWGTSVFRPETLKACHEVAADLRAAAPVVEQPQYSLLARGIEKGVMPMAQKLGMGLVVWSPLAGGVLTGKYAEGAPPAPGTRSATTTWNEKYATPENLRRVRELSSLAREMGVETGQLALAWLLTRPTVASVITGATNADQLSSNVKAAEVVIPEEVVKRIDRVFAA